MSYSKDNLPDGFREYQRRVPVRAIRIDGPFEVKTREGTLTCPDGWLAIDTSGCPYPIDADEFPRLYYGDGEQSAEIATLRQRLAEAESARDAAVVRAADALARVAGLERKASNQRRELRRLNKYLGAFWAGVRWSHHASANARAACCIASANARAARLEDELTIIAATTDNSCGSCERILRRARAALTTEGRSDEARM